MKSRNIADTSGRLLEGINTVYQDFYEKQGVETKIEQAVTDSMVTTGYITKFYPYLNKCEVKLHNNNKLVICKIMSLFGGDLLFLYTPTGEESFCETLKEPCIIPRGKLTVLVVNINNNDDDYVMLGYYFPQELIGLNPSAQSQFKILAIGGVNEYSIKFGLDGLKIVSNGDVELKSLDDLKGDVTTEYYTKKEIDTMIGDAINYING